MIEVREARPQDMTEVVKLARRLHATSEESWIPFSPSAMRKSLKGMIGRPDYTVLVAHKGGEPCGLLIGSVDCVIYGRTRFATDVVFRTDAGGDELLEKFKEWAVSMATKLIVMVDSHGGREPAKDRFFRKHGFEKVGGMYQMRIS